MTDFLKRSLAPITDAAWSEIDAQAAQILKGNLSARAVVDVDGPHGWAHAAVNLGAIEAGNGQPVKGVNWGRRQVLPLVEIRAPFDLDVADLDTLARGGKTPELAPVVKAAQQAALCEEQTVYKGFSEACMLGILEATENKPVRLPKEANGFAQAIEDAVHAIQANGIGGPFELILGRDPYQTVSVGDGRGYPLKARIQDMLGGGGLRWSPALSGGAVVSKRGGDFELTLGQDFSIGYAGHEGNTVRFFITESFAFRVLEPAAAVELKPAGGR
ncbi:MAG: bacteriocin family protein [Lentisphaerae bacterium]|nr:bacteriocin family protein [Lentisphaerota bacterium]